MVERNYPKSPLLAACTAIWRENKILLARRKTAPNSGSWAMPGGLVEVGETLEQAAVREVAEETSLVVDNLVFNRFTEIILHDSNDRIKRHFVLAMFVARSAAGLAVAGDDADAVGWFFINDLSTIPLTGHTEKFVKESHAILRST